MKVLIDTSFIYGLFVQKSPNHESAQKLLQKIHEKGQADLFFTTDQVIQESYSVFCIRIHEPTYLNTLDEFFYGKNCFFEILYLEADPAKTHEIVTIMKEGLRSSTKAAMSFVDASLIYMARTISASALLSFDGHFSPFLPSYGI